MDPSHDFPRWSREKKFSFGHMINLLLIKLFRSRWLYISLVPLCTFIDFDFVSVKKNAENNLENIQPS